MRDFRQSDAGDDRWQSGPKAQQRYADGLCVETVRVFDDSGEQRLRYEPVADVNRQNAQNDEHDLQDVCHYHNGWVLED